MFGFGSQAPANPQRLTPGQVLQAVLFEGVSPDRAQREHQDRLRQRALLERQMAVLDAATQFAMGGAMPAGGGQEPAVEPGRYNGPIGPGMDGAPLPGARETAPAPRPQPARTGTSRDFLPFELAGIVAGVPQLGEMAGALRRYDPSIKYERGFRYDERDPSSAPMFIPDLDKGQAPIVVNGQVVGIGNMPGAVASASQMAGAVEAAKAGAQAPYQFETYTDATGAPVTASRAQMAGQGPIRGQSPSERIVAEGGATRQVQRDNARPQAEQYLAQVDRKTTSVLEAIDRALAQVSGASAGLGSTTAWIPGSPARNLDATLDQIRATVGFEELQSMRDSSPTGGALGQVTERELALLQSVAGSLNQGQSPEQLRDNLTMIRDMLRQTREERRRTFEQQFGGQSAQPAQGGNVSREAAIQELRRRGLIQ